MPYVAPFARARAGFHRAILAGVAFALASAPFDLPALAFLPAPLLVLTLEVDPDDARPFRRAAWLGFVAGFFLHVTTFAWFPPMLVEHGRIPRLVALPIGALLFASQALPYAASAWLARTAAAAGLPLVLGLPLAISFVHTFAPQMFPFRPGVAVVEMLPFVQVVELLGEPLLDFLVAGVGTASLEAMRSRRPAYIALALTLFFGPLAYGLVRIPEVEAARSEGPMTKVGLVQPNIAIQEKHSAGEHRNILRKLRRLTAQVEREGAAIAVWPENAYPKRLAHRATHDRDLGMWGILGAAPQHTLPIVVGATMGSGVCDQTNSVVGFERDGTFTRRVDKVRLLPLVEDLPLWKYSDTLKRIQPCFGFIAGPHADVLKIAGLRLGILNCYEDLIATHARELMPLSPDFLVNVTNDAWFLDSQEPHQHHMAARLRAIETRRDLVRAVNTGVSGLITATGARGPYTRTFETTTLVVEVRSLTGTTPYTRYGDVFAYAAGALLALVALIAAARGAAAARRTN